MAMTGLTLLLLCSRLTLVVTMKMTKWLYLREVLCCGCSTSTRPRVLLTTESVQASLGSILYHNMRSFHLLKNCSFYFIFLSYVLKGKFWTQLCKTFSQVIMVLIIDLFLYPSSQLASQNGSTLLISGDMNSVTWFGRNFGRIWVR